AGLIDELRVQRKLLVQALVHAHPLQHGGHLVAGVFAFLLVAVAGDLSEGRHTQQAAQQRRARYTMRDRPCPLPNCSLLPHRTAPTSRCVRPIDRARRAQNYFSACSAFSCSSFCSRATMVCNSYPVRAKPVVSGACTWGAAACASVSPVFGAGACTGSPRCAISSIARSIGMRIVPGTPSTVL